MNHFITQFLLLMKPILVTEVKEEQKVVAGKQRVTMIHTVVLL